MKRMFKLYFSDKRIWLYIMLAVALFVYLLVSDIFYEYWYYGLLAILLAPLFEWQVHKYILHWNIGTIQQLKADPQKQYTIGQKTNIRHAGKTVEGEIIAIDKKYIKVGSGLAKKFPPLYRFMDDLHYHHHRNPDYVPLIFAPVLAVMLLYLNVGLITFLISWNLDLTVSILLGTVIYYLFYEWMHLGHHLNGYNHLSAYGRWMKKAHQLHHYKNEHYWWGITNPIGDVLFGTFRSNNSVKKSDTVKTINV